MTIPHKFGRCSDVALPLIQGRVEDKNPIRSKVNVLPLHTMRVGESLFFHHDEVPEGVRREARNSAKFYARRYCEGMFAFVKHIEPKLMLEIVRIK